ncbi:MAG: RnfH family protein [Ramlibacter sp.]|nr:RnfH family protein [Ramlibacter sp.]
MAERIRIEVLWSPAPREVLEWKGEVEAGATLIDAVRASGLVATEQLGASITAGVWGRKRRSESVLRDGDRVEVYRALIVDPKVARRERFRKQGIKTAGLFAQRRVGAKAGY